MLCRRGLSRQGYALLLSAYIAFVIWGSLVPFRVATPVPPTSIIESAMSRPLSDISYTDFAANILLFVPCGFLAMGAVAGRSISRRWVRSGLSIAGAAIGVSASIELMQLYFPARTFAPSDVAAETLGAIVGIGLWVVYHEELEALLRAISTSWANRPVLFGVLSAYAAVFVAVQLYPLDFTADISELGRKYRDGRIVFVPFSGPMSSAQILKNVAAAVPIGLAAGLMAASNLPVLAAWSIATAALAILEFAQVLVQSQASDATQVVTGSAGALLGALIARVLCGNTCVGARGIVDALPRRAVLLSVVWIAVVAAIQWWPLQFYGDPEFLRERVRTMMTSPADGIPRVGWNLFVGLSLGFLVSTAWPAAPHYRFGRLRIAALASLACSTLAAIEFGQLFVPDRHPHPSHAVAGVIGVMLGLHAERITMRSGH